MATRLFNFCHITVSFVVTTFQLAELSCCSCSHRRVRELSKLSAHRRVTSDVARPAHTIPSAPASSHQMAAPPAHYVNIIPDFSVAPTVMRTVCAAELQTTISVNLHRGGSLPLPRGRQRLNAAQAPDGRSTRLELPAAARVLHMTSVAITQCHCQSLTPTLCCPLPQAPWRRLRHWQALVRGRCCAATSRRPPT